LGVYLETAYAYFASQGFPVRPETETDVGFYPQQYLVGITDGVQSGFSGVTISEWNMEIDHTPYAREELADIAAHELFHTVQMRHWCRDTPANIAVCNSWVLKTGSMWLGEATATFAALDLYRWPGLRPYRLFDVDLAAEPAHRLDVAQSWSQARDSQTG